MSLPARAAETLSGWTRQIEAADWKRQAQNLLPPPQPAPQQAATSETAPATEPATTGNRLVRTWRWLRSTG